MSKTNRTAVTFYTVYFTGIGSNGSTRIFTDLEKAKVFSSHDYRDDPVKHTCKNPKTIAYWMERLASQNECDRWNDFVNASYDRLDDEF